MTDKNIKLNDDRLTFISFGGAGRFEGNLNAYCFQGKILLIDCGLGFADDYHPGVDIILPDPQWLEARQEDIVGLIVTHAHEDHVGAVGHLWHHFDCPIYATPFTAQVVKRKLSDHGKNKSGIICQIPLEGEVNLAPFMVKLINTSHSTPDASMVFIQTDHANVLHTGDWCLDDNPVMTERVNQEYLQTLGNQGLVDILVSDSTNAVKRGQGGSFSDLYQSFAKVLEQSEHSIVFACQGYSALSRIQVLGEIAGEYGRKIAISGGSIKRSYDIAVDLGMIERSANIISDREMMQLPRHERIFVCTGSQGEKRAALTRIAYENHHIIKLSAGDVVVFSARIIPGREKAIADMKRALGLSGVEIITNSEIPNVYISGHAYADEIKKLYQWVKPKAVLPIHGDFDHQICQADLAYDVGVTESYVPRNGDVIEIGHDKMLQFMGQVDHGYLAVDGHRIISAHESRSMQERRKIAQNGVVSVTLVLNVKHKMIQEPLISIVGLTEEDEQEIILNQALCQQVEKYYNKVDKADLTKASVVYEQIRLGVMRYIRDKLGKKPFVTTHIIRV